MEGPTVPVTLTLYERTANAVSGSDLMAIGWLTAWFPSVGSVVYISPSVVTHIIAVSGISSLTYIIRSLLLYLRKRRELGTKQHLAALETAKRVAVERPDLLAVEVVMEKGRVVLRFESDPSHPLSSTRSSTPLQRISKEAGDQSCQYCQRRRAQPVQQRIHRRVGQAVAEQFAKREQALRWTLACLSLRRMVGRRPGGKGSDAGRSGPRPRPRPLTGGRMRTERRSSSAAGAGHPVGGVVPASPRGAGLQVGGETVGGEGLR